MPQLNFMKKVLRFLEWVITGPNGTGSSYIMITIKGINPRASPGPKFPEQSSGELNHSLLVRRSPENFRGEGGLNL